MIHNLLMYLFLAHKALLNHILACVLMASWQLLFTFPNNGLCCSAWMQRHYNASLFTTTTTEHLVAAWQQMKCLQSILSILSLYSSKRREYGGRAGWDGEALAFFTQLCNKKMGSVLWKRATLSDSLWHSTKWPLQIWAWLSNLISSAHVFVFYF